MSATYHADVNLPATPDFPIDHPETRNIAQKWLDQLQSTLSGGSTFDLSDLLYSESWWRDMLTFDWDFHTLKGLEKVQSYVSQHQSRAQIKNLRLADEAKIAPAVEIPEKGTTWISAMFEFDTSCGNGSGVVYLTQEHPTGPWKAYSVYTALQGLKGFEDRVGVKRLEGTVDSMPGGIDRGTWIERRRRQIEFEDEEPTVLVIGAGQSGLNVSARLQTIGISCLVIDQNERVGDNWRNRYRTLVTHDHVDVTHLAYLPFPKNWSKYSSKDKLADWFEAYATLMELNVWLKTTIKSAEFDETQQRWSVTLIRDGAEREIRPHHVVWCAGQFGVEKVPNLANQSLFQGTVYHSKAHRDAALVNPKGKKVIVVGTGNSGHDIAEDFYQNGAQVTMIQRGATYVLGQAGIPLLPENAFVENDKIPQDVVDILTESLPWPVALALFRPNTRDVLEADKELLEGLKRSGFELDNGPHEQGITGLFVHRGGGYFIDFGCSQLIIDGKIKLAHCTEGVTGFDERHVLLGDGTRLEADIVVLATGYHGPLESVRKVLGSKVADQCHKETWGLDEQGEFNTLWRPSGHPGFWFMGGNLAQSRVYSRFVALQVAATEAGLVNPLPN
ncbi:hypothetical protein BJY04DRAFT_222588 [Aspergillus karnatakaensis]|uniref:uncharacterized protein n=1 Tax=Aspergillus karnatakaensis TaxID=1810916 RepID=UPI003CCCF5C0